MFYEVLLNESSDAVANVESFDNPCEAQDAFQSLCERFGSGAITLMRDNCPITEAQLAADIESYEIQMVREAATQLPSTYRHARGRDGDLGIGTDGYPHLVDKPPNPEDNYEK
ncbi:MAG: hypothetical protein ACXWID_04295 [Pyrinomonadaceae bacterium]